MSAGVTDGELLSFLWDKWKHHDSLVYERFRTGWLAHGLVFAVIAIIWGLDFAALSMRLLASGVLLLLLGVLCVGLLSMLKADLLCRNAFNPKIVALLRQYRDLFGVRDDAWSEVSWKVSDNSHPINLWHTPYPLRRGAGVRASRHAMEITKVFAYVEIVVGGFLIVWATAIWLASCSLNLVGFLLIMKDHIP